MNISKIEKQIIQLDLDYFPFPWSQDNWEEHFRHKSKKVSTLFLEDKVLAGFCCWEYMELENLCHIHKVFVLPKFRSKGLGEKLLHDSLVEMKAYFKDAKHCFLEVEETNDIARNLYSKIGFETLEIVPNFYGPRRNGARLLLNFIV